MNKYHRVWAEIDLSVIRTNIELIRASLPSGVSLMPVIKADGYGHGALAVAKVLDDVSDAFAVAVIEEAQELRDAGITRPVLILGTLSSGCFDIAVQEDVTVPVYTEDMAKALSDAAMHCGKKAKAHLVLNTGMNRIGMPWDSEGVELAVKICSYPHLDVCGIFSHFATADEADKSFAEKQYSRFTNFADALESRGIKLACRHICNSAAIVDLPHYHCDMVRPGIIAYGLAPSDVTDISDLGLKPAMECKSHVTYVKKVAPGEGISYGLTYVTDEEKVIATVPVGYADGYPRLLSNRGRVIIRGKYAPIVGRVCMDQFMVDVTHIDGVCVEDTVTLMGNDGDAFIGADELAQHAETINYEIVCGISKRVPRIYINNPEDNSLSMT